MKKQLCVAAVAAAFMFNLTDGNGLYAAFSTLPDNHRQQSNTETAVVPESAILLLMGAGLLGVGARRSKSKDTK